MRTLKALISLLCIALAISTNGEATPMKRFNFSIWTDYTDMKFKGLSQEEKTAKLQRLYGDQVNFVKNHGIRRVIVKILNPAEFDFFKTENFDGSRDDNFYYWAVQLSQSSELEVAFDPAPFDIGTQSWSDRFLNFAAELFKTEKPLGNFLNFREKLAWLSFINDMTMPSGNKQALVRGLVIDPKETEEPLFQHILNLLDQYKYNVSETLPPNPFPPLRLSAYLTIDQKAMTFCNLSHFPLLTDLRGQQPKDIGIVPPENFPSEGPDYLAPSWRSQINQPILDTVYLKMGDKRLIESIYQNREVLPNPTETNPERVKNLASDLGRNMRGVPFVKGPGIISNAKGAFTVNGKYTYFETGGGKYQQGQFVEGGIIEVRPPYVAAPIRKTVATAPENNKLLKLTSTFSTTEDIKEAEYYLTATPVHWISPKITNFIRARIYYVFSTNFEPNEGRFFGNWHLNNFLDFLSHPQRNHQEHSGFLYQSIFTNINGQLDPPVCNFVLHDFTTIPHGTPYPECDWGLGNQNHY